MSLSFTGLGPSVTFAEDAVNAAPALLDGSVVFTSTATLNASARLTVTGLLAQDIVGIRSVGFGSGQIDTSGEKVRFGGVTFGTFTGGTGTTLTVDLLPGTTAAQVDALIEALTYANASNTPTAARGLTITVQDNVLGTVSSTIAVNVTPENDAPVFTSGIVANVAETIVGTVYTAVATDPEGSAISYSLGGADAALFTITAGGAVSFVAPPDFEAPQDAGADNVYDIAVIASDGVTSSSRNVAITVADVNEVPVLTGLRANATFAENALNATPQLLDADVSFRIGDLPGGTLTITSTAAEDRFAVQSTGQGPGQILLSNNVVRFENIAVGTLAPEILTPANPLTFNLLTVPIRGTDDSGPARSTAIETLIESLVLVNTSNAPTQTRTITITYAEPNGGSSVSRSMVVTITPEDDAPVITSGATARFAEDGTGIAYQAAGNDPDGSVVTWSLGGADAALFSIGAADGAVRFLAPPDFGTPLDTGEDNSYDVLVRATADGVTTEKAVAITVTYVPQPNLLQGFGPAVTFAESAVNAAPRLLDSAVRFVPGNAPNGGHLSVGGLLPEDRVGLLDQGNAPGQIGVAGNVVSFGGVVIGTMEGGIGTKLDVTLNDQATAAAVDALIQALTYANASDTPTADRNLTLEYIDATGVPLNAPLVPPFADIPGVRLSQTVLGTSGSAITLFGLTAADVDGDGVLDIVGGRNSTSRPEALSWFRGLGGTDFAPEDQSGNPFAGLAGAALLTAIVPAFQDLDGDGDLDLVLGESGGTLLAWSNTGSGYAALAGAANPFDGIDVGTNSAPTFIDLDGDGRADLVVGSTAGDLRVWRNTTTGFVELTGAANPFDGLVFGPRTVPVAGQLDADGRPDLVVGYLGGLAAFRATSSGLLRLQDARDPFGDVPKTTSAAVPLLLDLTGDGLDDLVYAGGTYVNTTPVSVLPVRVLAEDDAPRGPRVVTLAPSAEDATRLITQAQLLAGWSDPEGAPLQALDLAVISDPAGTLVDHGDGTWSFTPALNDNSNVVFAFDVSDGTNQVGAVARMDLTPVNDAPTGIVNLLINASAGVLTTSAELADVDGIGEIAYRWQSFAGGAWQDIPGAIGLGFAPSGALLGALIRSVARYTDGDGTVEEVASTFVARIGSAGNDAFASPGRPSLQSGGAGNDTIAGVNQRDLLFGGAGDDSIAASNGNDIILGEAGADTLSGGAGFDIFRYIRLQDGGDLITDFTPGADTIQVDATFFKGLPLGTLAPAHFAAGGPTAAIAQILYAGGVVSFDPDGTGPAASVMLATLAGAPAITASDIFVIP